MYQLLTGILSLSFCLLPRLDIDTFINLFIAIGAILALCVPFYLARKERTARVRPVVIPDNEFGYQLYKNFSSDEQRTKPEMILKNIGSGPALNVYIKYDNKVLEGNLFIGSDTKTDILSVPHHDKIESVSDLLAKDIRRVKLVIEYKDIYKNAYYTEIYLNWEEDHYQLDRGDFSFHEI